MTHQLFLNVKDHSVSKESFDLYHDTALDLVYTHPQPAATDLVVTTKAMTTFRTPTANGLF
jgi:hypothetical protein